MENDHLEDALLFLKSALRSIEHGRPVSRHDIERAIEEINLERATRPAKESEGHG